jgi:hypothetical protein
MDGRAVTDAYEPDYVAAHPVEFDQVPEPEDATGAYDYSDDEIGSVQEELKSLGYL